MQSQNEAKGSNVNPLRYLFGKTWHYSEGNHRNIVSYWIMFIVAESFSLVSVPLVTARIMDVIQQQNFRVTNTKPLFGLLALMILIKIVFWLLHGPGRVIERANAFKARVNAGKYLFKGVMTLPVEWHVEHHSGNTIDKMKNGTTALFKFSEDSFEVIYAVVQLIISYGMLAYTSHSAAYIVLIMMIVMAGITMLFDRVLVPQYRQLNHAENRIAEGIADAINNVMTIIILRMERPVFEANVRRMEEPYKLFRRNGCLSEAKWFLTSFCCVLTVAFVLGAYFWHHHVTGETVLIGDVVILMTYLTKVTELSSRFNNMYGDILQQKTKVMNSEEVSKDFQSKNFTNHVLPRAWRRLSIDGLNFSYHDAEGALLHLQDISLSFAHGERIALVGESGSGKSSLLKVMRGLSTPRSMKLSVDGAEIPEGFEGICRAITLVPQDPEIFATTIRENITIGAEYDPEFVRRFTDMACFTEVVAGLPHGLDSSIKEKGVNLSGGQQQRLALARGLLASDNKDIVLLDEPTSSVDTGNEGRIYRKIFREFSDKTIISSIHRLHLLSLFDRICFMSKGRIIASGSLSELLSTCPEFQALWQEYHKSNREVVAMK